MKSIQEIENMDFERLEAIADDNKIKAPEGMKDSIEATVTAAGIIEDIVIEDSHMKGKARRQFQRGLWISSFATIAAACLIVFAILADEPKDTFDDPQQAYEQLEQTLAFISSKVEKGYGMTN